MNGSDPIETKGFDRTGSIDPIETKGSDRTKGSDPFIDTVHTVSAITSNKQQQQQPATSNKQQVSVHYL